MIRARNLPDARRDLDEAIAYLEARAPGLGLELLLDFEETLAQACERPELAAPIAVASRAPYLVRRYLFSRFRYALIVAQREDELVVIAVAHQRRKPGYWKPRLANVRP